MLHQKGTLASIGGIEASVWQWVSTRAGWVALAIFIANVALKLPFLAGSSLFLDEAVAIYDTQGSIGDTIAFSAKDPTPPLFYLIVGLWCKVFGISELSARFPSMLFSAGAASMLFWLGHKHFNVRVGLFAALFFTTSRAAMVFAHEARSYALAGLLMVVSYHCYLYLTRAARPGWGVWVGLILANVLLLYTHYLTAMGIAAQALMSLWLLRREWRTFVAYVGSQLIVLMFWLPWVLYNRSQLQDSKVTSWLKPPDLGILENVVAGLLGSEILLGIGAAIVLLGLMAAIWSLKQAKAESGQFYRWLTAAAWFGLSIILQYGVARLFMPVFDLRYVMYALPGAMLLLAASIAYFPVPRLLQYGLVAAQLVAAGMQLELNPPKSEDWREAVDMVKSIENEKTGMVVISFYHYIPFSYYYNRDHFKHRDETVDLLTVEHIHFGQDTNLIPVIDDSLYSNVILVLVQESLADPQGNFMSALQRRYCIANRGVFRGVRIIQFQNPPCKASSAGHFVQEYAVPQIAEEADRTIDIADTASADGRGTFVGAGHEYGLSRTWLASEVFGGNFANVELHVRGRVLDPGKKIMLVFTMEHGGQSYFWTGIELQEGHKPGEWFDQKATVDLPPIQDPTDVVKMFIWSPDGGGGEFDKVVVDFWEG